MQIKTTRLDMYYRSAIYVCILEVDCMATDIGIIQPYDGERGNCGEGIDMEKPNQAELSGF